MVFPVPPDHVASEHSSAPVLWPSIFLDPSARSVSPFVVVVLSALDYLRIYRSPGSEASFWLRNCYRSIPSTGLVALSLVVPGLPGGTGVCASTVCRFVRNANNVSGLLMGALYRYVAGC